MGEVREMRNAETELIITEVHLEVVTGEPRETETLIRGSGRGRWKSTCKGNSLAAYSTASVVEEGYPSGGPILGDGGWTEMVGSVDLCSAL